MLFHLFFLLHINILLSNMQNLLLWWYVITLHRASVLTQLKCGLTFHVPHSSTYINIQVTILWDIYFGVQAIGTL